MTPSVTGAGYDDAAQRRIPGYKSLARLAVSLVATFPSLAADAAPLLVVGCGTGAELSEARRQRPDWTLTAVDPSVGMVAEAKARLGAAAAAVTWIEGPAQSMPGEACFGAAIAVLVMQELADDGSKLDFLSALARLLQPGAPLVLVDLMRGGSGLNSAVEQQFNEALLRFQRSSDLPPPSVDEVPLHPIGEARRSALLAAAGFSDPIRFYQALGVDGVLVQKLQ
jgi:tRNA (cmo5U34)-methyltransferase|tara:strand:+ start:159 stop:833 length:675 start_codon:yes stop_codon:yes gene_type:complete